MLFQVRRERPVLSRLLVAVAASAAALLLRHWLVDSAQGSLPLMSSLLAVIVAAAFGGLWPGLLATALCAYFGVVGFVEGGWMALQRDDALRLGGFSLVAGLTSLLFEALHRAQQRAGFEHADARYAREQRERSRGLAHEAELRSSLFKEASFDALYDWSLESGEISWNERLNTLYGHAQTRIPRAHRWWAGHIHPDDLNRTRNAYRAARRARDVRWSAEFRLRCADGSYVWVLSRARALYDARGRLRRVIGAVQDISDRQRATETLMHFKAVFEALPSPVLVCDPQLRVVAASQAYLQITHTPRSALIGRPLLQVFPDGEGGASAARVRAAYEKVLATGLPEQMPVLPYSVPAPPELGGGLRRRWWNSFHYPVLGPQGEVAFVIQRVDDVTDYVRDPQSDTAELSVVPWIDVPAQEARNLEHAQQLAQANQRLGAANLRLAFMAQLSELTRELLDPEAVVAAIAHALGTYLGVNRCIWLEFTADQQGFEVLGGYTDGVPGMCGHHRMAEFGLPGLARGAHSFVVDDVEADPDARPFLATYRRYDIRATVSVPLRRGEVLVAGLAVHERAPRSWQPDEVELIEQVAQRCLDALERARAQRALAANEERLRSLMDAMPARVSTLDAAGRADYLHPSWVSYSGLQASELQGDGWRSLFPPEERASYERVWRNHLQTGLAFSQELRLRGAGGEYRWNLARVAPVHDAQGRVRSWVSAMTDIQELKQVEDELRGSNQLLRLLAQLSDTVQSLTDVGQIARTVCEAVGAHLGASRCKYLRFDADGAHYEVLAEYRSGVGARLGRHSAQIFAGPGFARFHAMETLVREDLQAADDGGGVQLAADSECRALILVPMHDAQQLIGALAVQHRDVRRWTEAEVEAAELGGNLCFESIKRAESVEQQARSLERLREADRAKDEFLATLAHELRNPLAPLANGVQLLRTDGANESLRAQMLGILSRQLAQMVRLVDDLLDVSRITTGKLVLQLDVVELESVVRQAVESVEPLLRAGQHHLQISLPEPPLRLRGDAARLSQVLANLLTNSAKYSERPGVLRLQAQTQGGHLHISLEDQGIGIAPDVLPRVFDMFAQSDRALSRAQGGLGIGLSLVRKLVELHGGRVEAASEGTGRGSRFTVILPLDTALQQLDTPPADLAPTHARAPVALPAQLRVLVADDNRDSAESLAELLRLWGHQVQIALDGEAALDVAADFRPHAMVLDLGMPRRDGLDAARAVRAQPWGGAVALIALSGWGQNADRERSRAAGFDHHLVKPVDAQRLRELLG